MRKILSTSIWTILFLFALPICLSANKYPPAIQKQIDKLESCEGMQRIKTLSSIIRMVNSYDTLAAQKYHQVADSLIAYSGFSEEEKLIGKREILITQTWVHLNNGNLYKAFQQSIVSDSIAQKLAMVRDSLDDYIYTTYLNSNTIRCAIYSNQKQYQKAQRELENSIAICQKMNDKSKLGSTLNNLGIVFLLQEKYEEAEVPMLKSDSIYRATDSGYDLAYCTILRTDLYRNSEQWQKGQDLLNSSRKYVEKHVPSRINNLNAYAAEIALELGNTDLADSLIADCLATLDEVKEPAAVAESQKVIAGIFKKQGKFEEALNLYDDSREELEPVEDILHSSELFKLMEAYEQSLIEIPQKNSNKFLWLLLGLVPLGILFFFFKRKPEPAEPTSHTLEIAWKDESLLEQQDPFLDRFVELVQNQMEDGDISVDGISEQMKISRVQLFNKIKASTGKSPSQVIRQIRLETAERLLVANNTTVSEVAYKVGFSSPNNFSRSFKDYFGDTPKSYLAKKSG